MPDPELLPPGRSIGSAPRDNEGVTGVLRAATRRRRARVAAAGAAGLASAVVAALLIGAGGANDSLRTTNPPAGQPGVAGTNSAEPTAPQGVGTGAPAPTVTGLPSAVSVPPNVIPTASPRPSPSAPSPSPEPVGTEVGPPHTVTDYDASRRCDGDGPTPAQGWCSYYDGALSGKGGSAVELAAAVCRITGQGSGTYTVDSGEQASFSAYDAAGYQQWLWSKGHHFSPASSEIVVPAGKCIRWAVAWDVTNQAGHPLSPGTYELFARPQGHASGDTYVTSNAGTLTFTVNG